MGLQASQQLSMTYLPADRPECARPRAQRCPQVLECRNLPARAADRKLLRPGTGALRWIPLGNRKSQIANRKSFDCAGFTLIELMVVIILIGIMTAVILPEMRGTYEDALLRSTSRELVGVCDLASSHAISANRVHRLRVDPKTGHYSIQRRAEERGLEMSFVAAREVPGGEGELDTRITVEIHTAGDDPLAAGAEEAPPATGREERSGPREDGITFYPDGTADPSEILLRDRDGFRLALRINPVTARVRIIELARK
jgi:type II secretion system protein H